MGIEPSGDMIAIARQKTCENAEFIQAYADNTTLPDNFADVAVCSQSFHWMEPVATLKEVNRILKPGGVFATIDCDWPPVTLWQAEKAYMTLYRKVKDIESTAAINSTAPCWAVFIRFTAASTISYTLAAEFSCD